MKTRIINYDNKKALIIYINKQERYISNVEEFIAKSKKQYEEVVIFVSGDSKLENVLHNLICDK